MPVLAFDTAAEFGSIALVDHHSVREEILLHAPEGFSGILFAQMEAMLNRQSMNLTDIDLFAAASGPGSFTGVRVGLAALKGLSEVLQKPAVAVSNLQALATLGQGSGLRAPLIDARRGEVYAALLRPNGSPVIPESVLTFPRFLELTEAREFEWISSNFDPFLPAIRGTRFEGYPLTVAPRALAGAIARLAMSLPPQDTASIEANYVRRSDAELLWKS